MVHCAQTCLTASSLRIGQVTYDLGTLLTPGAFTERRLMGRLEAFASNQIARHKISRLTVSLKQDDLVYARPGLTLMFENPKIFNGSWNRQNSIAQVLCLNGRASALLKYGESVKHLQILGDRDPRELTVDGQAVHLVSFAIRNGNISLDQLSSSQSSNAWITIYVQTNPLLSIAQAEHLLTALDGMLGTDAVELVVRSDPISG
jgi:hypothetical protein